MFSVISENLRFCFTRREVKQKMLTFFILTALVAQGSSQMARVIGGQYASPGFFRYQVSLQIMGQHFCGGSIISETCVITAAHCIKAFNWYQIKVLVGTVDLTNRSGQYIDVYTVLEHPYYNANDLTNDIALIKLAQSLRLGTGNVDKIEISTASISLHEPKLACLSGFGQVNDRGEVPNYLKFAYVPVWFLADCIPHLISVVQRDRMICAGELNGQGSSCKGDSGGPLVLDGKLYGIVSWGYGCGFPYRPSVYTYVPFYRSWIQQYVNL